VRVARGLYRCRDGRIWEPAERFVGPGRFGKRYKWRRLIIHLAQRGAANRVPFFPGCFVYGGLVRSPTPKGGDDG
jgi:hypothetical protein